MCYVSETDSFIGQFYYGSADILKKMEQYHNEALINLNEYDECGNPIFESSFDDTGTLTYECRYICLKAGKHLPKHLKKRNKEVEYNYIFDKEGNLIKASCSDGRSEEYKDYDMHKNWTIKYHYNDGVLTSATKRVIEYY